MPEDFVLIVPFRAVRQVAMIAGICPRCSRRLADNRALIKAMHVRLREIWAEVQLLDPVRVLTEWGRA